MPKMSKKIPPLIGAKSCFLVLLLSRKVGRFDSFLPSGISVIKLAPAFCLFSTFSFSIWACFSYFVFGKEWKMPNMSHVHSLPISTFFWLSTCNCNCLSFSNILTKKKIYLLQKKKYQNWKKTWVPLSASCANFWFFSVIFFKRLSQVCSQQKIKNCSKTLFSLFGGFSLFGFSFFRLFFSRFSL